MRQNLNNDEALCLLINMLSNNCSEEWVLNDECTTPKLYRPYLYSDSRIELFKHFQNRSPPNNDSELRKYNLHILYNT